MGEQVLFWIFAAISMACSTMVVVGRNPVTCAIALVGNLFMLACFYAMLGADFLAAIQIIVYAGAIMVLFIFVIMLLNLEPDALRGPNLPLSELIVLGLIVASFTAVGWQLSRGMPTALMSAAPSPSGADSMSAGNTYMVGLSLFTTYLWPFELSSILILLAIIASVVIAKKPKTTPPEKVMTSHGAH